MSIEQAVSWGDTTFLKNQTSDCIDLAGMSTTGHLWPLDGNYVMEDILYKLSFG